MIAVLDPFFRSAGTSLFLLLQYPPADPPILYRGDPPRITSHFTLTDSVKFFVKDATRSAWKIRFTKRGTVQSGSLTVSVGGGPYKPVNYLENIPLQGKTYTFCYEGPATNKGLNFILIDAKNEKAEFTWYTTDGRVAETLTINPKDSGKAVTQQMEQFNKKLETRGSIYKLTQAAESNTRITTLALKSLYLTP